MGSQDGQRRQRSNGAESRRRILDAAAEVAAERGYEGTTIALVSASCGLPASSIYWHFQDKDDLIAAVIEREFASWLIAVEAPASDVSGPLDRIVALSTGIAKALIEQPQSLRLGLMLALERRPDEPRGRAVFLRFRELARRRVSDTLTELFPELDAGSVRSLTTFVIATADGLFVAHEVDEDPTDLIALFEQHARLFYDTASRWAGDTRTSTTPLSHV